MFALSFVFLVALLIVLSVFIFQTSLHSEEQATQLAIAHRVYDLDQSLQTIIRDLAATTGNTRFSISNRTVSIAHDFPSASLANLTSALTTLKTFAEADDPAIRFDLTNIATRPYVISPYGMNYSHPDNTTIMIIPTMLNYNSYTFHFTTPGKPLGTITWKAFDAGTFPVTIITSNGNSSQTSTQYVDITDDVKARIEGISSGQIRIDIDEQEVEITSTLDTTTTSNTTVTFAGGTARPAIFLPGLYTISFPAFNLTKTSGVALTTNP